MNANFARMQNFLACALLWTALTEVKATSDSGFRLPEMEATLISSTGMYGEFQLTLGREIVWSERGGRTAVPSSDPSDGFFADHDGVVRRGLFQKFFLPKFQGSIDVWYYCRHKHFSLDSLEWVGPTDLADYFPLPSWTWRSMLAQHAQARPEEENPAVASYQTKLLMLQMHVHVSALCLSRPSDVLERYNTMIAAFDSQIDDDLLPDDDFEDDEDGHDETDDDLLPDDDFEDDEDGHDETDSKMTDSIYTLAYGELTDLTTMRLVQRLDLSAADTVVDLGSGLWVGGGIPSFVAWHWY